MRTVIQRVTQASVSVDGSIVGQIGNGLLVLVGIEDADTHDDALWLARKIVGMRIFNDSEGVMNLSVTDVGGSILCISQFTLMASTKKGNRPSYIRASKAEFSQPMYLEFCRTLEQELGRKVETGIFGADMKVSLLNDGPVTIVMDTKQKE